MEENAIVNDSVAAEVIGGDPVAPEEVTSPEVEPTEKAEETVS